MRTAFPLLLGLMMVLSGCSTSNEVIGRGPIQKRKFRPGWHVDIGGRTHDHPARVRSVHEPSPVAIRIPWSDRSLEPELLTSRTLTKMGPITNASPRSPDRRSTIKAHSAEKTAVRSTFQQDEPATPEGERRWNFMAIVSGIFLILSAIGVGSWWVSGIIPYLFTFSVLTGIIGLLLCIKYKERGKGIAIAAILGPLLVVALAVAALNAAW